MRTTITKKVFLSFALISAGIIQLTAQVAPPYQWVNQAYPAPGNYPPQVTPGAIAVDATGNSYVTGTFTGRTMFGKGADTIPVTEQKAGTNDNSDTYLAKYDNTGKIIWVRQAEIKQHYSGFNYGSGLAVDASNNIYITGVFHDTVVIGANVLTTSTTTGNRSGAFIAKYDASGNLVWAKKAGTGDIYTAGIAVDASGNCYLDGQMAYSGTIAGSAFSNGFFVAKYDMNGDPVWAAGNQGNCFGHGIACSGPDLFVTGYYYGTTVFGSTTLTNPVPSNTQIFIAKLDLSGAFTWAAGNTSTDVHMASNGWCVAADNSGNCFVGGTYTSELKLGTDVLSGTSTQSNAFLVKYNNAGAEQWMKSFIATNGNGNAVNGVCADNSGNAFITGIFGYQTNFGVTTLSSPAGGFVSKFSPSGTNLWAAYAGIKYGKAIACDPTGGVNFIGTFQYSETFGTLTVNNASFFPSTYVARLGNATGVDEMELSADNINLYPNPASEQVTLAFEKELKNAQLNVTDLLGQTVFAVTIENTKQVSLDCSGWIPGVYFVRTTEGNASVTKKLIINK